MTTTRIVLTAWLATAGLCVSMAFAGAPDDGLASARDAVDHFGSALQAVLGEALAKGDPVAAIGVCSEQAPGIAAQTGADAGLRLGRVSRRPRNPANAPTDWQRGVLEQWAAELVAGADLAGREVYVAAPDGGFRYLRPILIRPPCLVCHGTDVAPAVTAKLSELYPDDRATGYRIGELRGAFTASRQAGIVTAR